MAKEAAEKKECGDGGQQGALPTSSQSSHRGLVASRHTAPKPFWEVEPFHRMREEFNRLFDRMLPAWAGPGQAEWQQGWNLDVEEDQDKVEVRAEAPGFEPSEFDIQVRGDQLVLHAAHSSEEEEKERGSRVWQRQEFYRSVPLPSSVNPDKVEATYRNGILSVTMPKTEEARGRRIEVKS
jgi:HSP20 family protein